MVLLREKTCFFPFHFPQLSYTRKFPLVRGKLFKNRLYQKIDISLFTKKASRTC